MNEWRNIDNITQNSDMVSNSYTNGIDVIESYGFKVDALMWCPFALMALCGLYATFAYIGLRIKVKNS